MYRTTIHHPTVKKPSCDVAYVVDSNGAVVFSGSWDECKAEAYNLNNPQRRKCRYERRLSRRR